MRDLSVDVRLRIVKLVISNKRSHEEVADMFNIKVQAVRDLMKNLKKGKSYFVKKR